MRNRGTLFFIPPLFTFFKSVFLFVIKRIYTFYRKQDRHSSCLRRYYNNKILPLLQASYILSAYRLFYYLIYLLFDLIFVQFRNWIYAFISMIQMLKIGWVLLIFSKQEQKVSHRTPGSSVNYLINYFFGMLKRLFDFFNMIPGLVLKIIRNLERIRVALFQIDWN